MARAPVNMKSFCSLPFSHLSVGPDGKLRICCNNYEMPRTKDGKTLPNPVDDSFSILDSFNSDLHKEIRQSMMRGDRHPTCFRCWEIEDGGGTSYRGMFNSVFESKVLQEVLPEMSDDATIADPRFFYVELTLGNKCNLRCRMCSPWSSIQWLNEAKELNLWNSDEKTLKSLQSFDWFENPRGRKFIIDNLKYVDRLNVLGGEPLLITEHFDFLKACIDNGRASEVVVQYNSNLTRVPEGIKDLWKHFKKVQVNLSIDGVGELNEYIRYPMRWNEWIENVRTLASWRSEIKLDLSFHSTFQSLNVTRAADLYRWIWDFATELDLPRVPFAIYVTKPTYLDPRHLPEEIKTTAVARLEDYFSFLQTQSLTDLERLWLGMIRSHMQTMSAPDESSELLFNKFIETMALIDKSRKQRLNVLLPEFDRYY